MLYAAVVSMYDLETVGKWHDCEFKGVALRAIATP